jgi:hypothetical protein
MIVERSPAISPGGLRGLPPGAGACRKATDASPLPPHAGPTATLRPVRRPPWAILRLRRPAIHPALGDPARSSADNLAERHQDLLASFAWSVHRARGRLPIRSGHRTGERFRVQDLSVETASAVAKNRHRPRRQGLDRLPAGRRRLPGLEPDAKAEAQLWRHLPMGKVSLAETALDSRPRQAMGDPNDPALFAAHHLRQLSVAAAVSV